MAFKNLYGILAENAKHIFSDRSYQSCFKGSCSLPSSFFTVLTPVK